MSDTQLHDQATAPVTHARRLATRGEWREHASSILMRWAGPAVPVVIMAIMGYRQRWVTEDAFISLRVVEQILAGNGPVFNRGERVEAYTHPLWVAILTVWGGLGLPTAEGSVILGLVLSVVGLIAALAGASRLADRMNGAHAAVRRPASYPTADVMESADGRGRARSRPCSPPGAVDDGSRAGNEPGPSRRRVPTTPSLMLTFPLGALIFVVIPVVWDFVTSGLETGLSFAWLGLSFWLLVRECFDEGETERLTRLKIGSAVVIGLGPLVRPDLAIFSAGFLLSLIVCSNHQSISSTLRRALLLGAAAGALPLAYQVFRMGYFATLVPNTALAKEASDARWEQGRIYLRDFIDPYHLWLPLLIAAGFLALAALRAWQSADRRALVVMTASVVSGLLHAVYVVRVGGDFMHGRFLLPTLFGLLLPVMLVRVPLSLGSIPRTAVASAALLLIAGWSLGAAIWFRIPYLEFVSDDGLADERGVYVVNAGHHNPITLDDYMQMRLGWPRDGQTWHDLADEDARVLIVDEDRYPLTPSVDEGTSVVAIAWNIGLSGYAAGLDVHVADRHGLSDPIASRLILDERRRPGHEKQLDPAWAIARFSDSSGSAENTRAVSAARTILGCGEVEELLDAVNEPMTAGRFLDNLFLSFSLHDLRIPTDPEAAADELC